MWIITAGVQHTPRVITHLVVTSVSVTTDTDLKDHDVSVCCFVLISSQSVVYDDTITLRKSVTLLIVMYYILEKNIVLHSYFITSHKSDVHRDIQTAMSHKYRSNCL